jgi:MFS family permease
VGSNSSWLVEQILAGSPTARVYSAQPSLLRGLLGPQHLNTDTQEYMDRGVAGAQMVYMRGTTDYHTELDNAERLGRGSLQMNGDYAVGLARRLGDDELTRRTGDRSTYFNITGGVIVQYGPAIALVLASLTAGLFVAAVVVGRRRNSLSLRGLLGGAAASLAVTLAATAAAVFAWIALKRAVPDLRVFSIGSDQNALFAAALMALALAVVAALYLPLLRRHRTEGLALGALLWWVVLSMCFAVAAPSAAYMWTLPALAASAVALRRLAGGRARVVRSSAGACIPLAVLIVVFAPMVLFFAILAFRLDGLGLPVVGLVGLFAALAAGLFVSQLGGRRLLPIGAVTAAVLLTAVAIVRLGFDEEFPRPDFVGYVYDADARSATWETGDRDSWTEPLMRDAEKADIVIAPFATVEGWRAAAAPVRLAAPELTRLGSRSSGGTTTLRLRLRSRRASGNVAARLRSSTAIAAATVEGESFPRTGGMGDGELELSYVGLPEEGITVRLELRGHGVLRASVSDVTQGLPAGAGAPPRPPATMPMALSFRADPTTVRSSVRLRY